MTTQNSNEKNEDPNTQTCLVRTAFEEWITAPPYEKDVDRFSDGDSRGWVGSYKDIDTDLAWQAYRASAERPRETPNTSSKGISGMSSIAKLSFRAEKNLNRAYKLQGGTYQHGNKAPMVLTSVFINTNGKGVAIGLEPANGIGLLKIMSLSGLKHWKSVS